GDSGSPLICGTKPQGLAAYTPNNCLDPQYPEGDAIPWWCKANVPSPGGGMESRIIGGNEAKPHSRPYMVSVQINKKHVCGGMLIKNNYVLTAAHCVKNTEYNGKHKLEVLLGAHNISQKETQQQRIQVQKYIKHPCYKENGRLNDIMLLKLKSKAKESKAVKPIGLPKQNENISDQEKCSIAGWGRTHQNSAVSSVLREVTLKIQNNNECERLWQQYFDTDNMICTATDGRKAFCQGDSGGPLICGKKLQGLAAYTHPENCLNHEYPEVCRDMAVVAYRFSNNKKKPQGGMEGHIIGGNEVNPPHSRPYMVSVQFNSRMCGGMLIRNDYVLTAAHCIKNTVIPGQDKLEVLLGAHNINDNEPEQQRIQVQKYIKHPCYKENGFLNDIMLLKLKSKAKQNKAVKLIDLPTQNENIADQENCSIAGWGWTKKNSTPSSVLREVTLKIQNNTECERLWQQHFDTDHMICTAFDGIKAFCQ
ncbi:granzyme B-like, partial [Clarias magur]